MNQDIFSVISLVIPVILISCGMVLAGLLVTVRFTESRLVINTCVVTNVTQPKLYISMAHAQMIVQFRTNLEINGIEISAIILVFTAGIFTGMVLVNPIAIILS